MCVCDVCATLSQKKRKKEKRSLMAVFTHTHTHTHTHTGLYRVFRIEFFFFAATVGLHRPFRTRFYLGSIFGHHHYHHHDHHHHRQHHHQRQQQQLLIERSSFSVWTTRQMVSGDLVESLGVSAYGRSLSLSLSLSRNQLRRSNKQPITERAMAHRNGCRFVRRSVSI